MSSLQSPLQSSTYAPTYALQPLSLQSPSLQPSSLFLHSLNQSGCYPSCNPIPPQDPHPPPEPSFLCPPPPEKVRQTQREVKLRGWGIQIFPGGMLVVLGTKEGDKDGDTWRSSPIAKRISATVIETRSGTKYVLQGRINRTLMTQKMDPDSYRINANIVSKFARGFPKGWAKLIINVCEEYGIHKDTSEPPVVTRSQTRKKQLTAISSVPTTKNDKKECVEEIQHKTVKLETPSCGQTVTKPRKLMSLNIKKVVKKEDMNDSTIISCSLKLSSRGRVIKPVLGADVSYECDMKGNFIGLSLRNFSTSDVKMKEKPDLLTCGSKWNAEEVLALQRAVSSVPAISKNFWQQVASKLGTDRSWLECKKKHDEGIHLPKKKVKLETVSCKRVDPILAKRGTLKRSKQIQGMAKMMDVGYSDDVFEATPLKKKAKIIQIEDLDGDDDDGEDDDGGGNGEGCTPVSSWREKLGAPVSSTPDLSNHLCSPDDHGRRSLIKYM